MSQLTIKGQQATKSHSPTGHRVGNIPHLWRVVLVFLLFPSVLGLAVCQHATFAKAHIHQVEVLLPSKPVDCEVTLFSAPAQFEGSQMADMTGTAGGTQICTVSQETMVTKQSLRVESSVAVTMSLTGGDVPAFGVPVSPGTFFLSEAFASPRTPPPRV